MTYKHLRELANLSRFLPLPVFLSPSHTHSTDASLTTAGSCASGRQSRAAKMVILVIYKLCLFKKKIRIVKKMARWREKEGRWETVGCIILTSSISVSAIYYSLASLSTSLILHSQQKIGQCGKRLSFRNCDCRLAIRFSFLQLKDKTSYYRCLSQNTSVLIFVAMSFTFRQILHFKKLWMTKLQQFETHCNAFFFFFFY